MRDKKNGLVGTAAPKTVPFFKQRTTSWANIL